MDFLYRVSVHKHHENRVYYPHAGHRYSHALLLLLSQLPHHLRGGEVQLCLQLQATSDVQQSHLREYTALAQMGISSSHALWVLDDVFDWTVPQHKRAPTVDWRLQWRPLPAFLYYSKCWMAYVNCSYCICVLPILSRKAFQYKKSRQSRGIRQVLKLHSKLRQTEYSEGRDIGKK